jgi:uncharacterized Ntn-hydrolase superfamily protein
LDARKEGEIGGTLETLVPNGFDEAAPTAREFTIHRGNTCIDPPPIWRYGPRLEGYMLHSRRILAAAPLLPLLLLATTPAGATYSIAATDQATQQVGGAVTSCVGSQGVTIVYGAAPGFGAINAQASVVSTANRDEGVQLLQMGVAPASVIQQLNASDSGSASRQYGVVDLQGRVAGFTGSACGNFADHVTGSTGSFTYSIQGNILTGAAVLTQAETAFVNQGCDLADKLMLSLEAGAKNGQGDSRCTTLGTPVPANAAMIEVDLEGQPAGSYLRLTNAKNGSVNAVTALRAQFDTWRQTHPCMQPDGGTPDAGADAGAKDASVGDVRADSTDAAPADADASTGSGGAAGNAGQGGAAGNAGASGSGGTAGAAGAGSGGTAGARDGGQDATTADGAAGKGGTAGTSGTGGSAGMATGGVSGTGGPDAGQPPGSGGASGATGGTNPTAGRGGSGGSSGSGGNSSSDDGGCSCRISQPESGSAATLILSVVALIATRLRRSKRRR